MTYQRCEGASGFHDTHESDRDATDGLCAACRTIMRTKEVHKPTSWDFFAVKRENSFNHFHSSTLHLGVCGGEKGNMFLVRLTLNPDGLYWGWYNSFHPVNSDRGGQVSMVFQSEIQVSVCFAYGPEAETRRGRGEIVRLRVEEIRLSKHPEGIR